MSASYYQVLGSLPHLAGFDRLKALPVGPLRYEERLRQLDPEERALVAWLRARLWPERASFQPGPALADVPESLRQLVGQATQAARMAAEVARDGGAEHDSLAGERDRLRALWEAVDRLTAGNGFDCAAIVRNVIRWDIANAWLAADADRAEQRVDALASELAGEWVACD